MRSFGEKGSGERGEKTDAPISRKTWRSKRGGRRSLFWGEGRGVAQKRKGIKGTASGMVGGAKMDEGVVG